MAAQELLNETLAEVAAKLRDRKVTARQLAEAAIAAHEETGVALEAYKIWDPDRARALADAADALFDAGTVLGPLQGIPCSVKDLYAMSEYPTHAGTPNPLPPKWRADGPVVQALRRQLAVIPGKTHTVEFAFGGIGTNVHWGAPRNPWDAANHRVSGGSSSGAGVSLCEGSALVALGTDTAGSVRIPASVTGNVGVKTTFGRWSLDGIVPLSPSLDTAGVLARTVADAALAFAVLDPQTTEAPERFVERLGGLSAGNLRLGLCDEHFWDDCSPGVAEGVKAAIDELVGKGAELKRLAMPEPLDVHEIFLKGGLPAVELFTFLKLELPDWLETLDANVRQRMDEAETLPASEYLSRRAMLDRLSAAVDDRLRAVDVLVTPTVAVTPPTLDELADGDAYRRANMLSLRNTSTVNYLGLCAVTVPVALDAVGMPVGLHLIARNGEDEKLLAVALAVEQALGTGRQRIGRPPLAAG